MIVDRSGLEERPTFCIDKEKSNPFKRSNSPVCFFKGKYVFDVYFKGGGDGPSWVERRPVPTKRSDATHEQDMFFWGELSRFF